MNRGDAEEREPTRLADLCGFLVAASMLSLAVALGLTALAALAPVALSGVVSSVCAAIGLAAFLGGAGYWLASNLRSRRSDDDGPDGGGGGHEIFWDAFDRARAGWGHDQQATPS